MARRRDAKGRFVKSGSKKRKRHEKKHHRRRKHR
jgi:hypothetical protein